MRALLAVLGLFCFAAVFGAIFLVRYSGVEPPKLPVLSFENNTTYTPKTQNEWIAQVAQVDKSQTNLPANIIHIEIANSAAKKIGFELTFNEYSAYAQFCISRVAKEHGVDLDVIKMGSDARFLLGTSDRDLAQKVVLGLRKYSIYSELKESGL